MSLPFLRVRPEEGGVFFGYDRSIAVSAVVTSSRIIKIIYLAMSVMLIVISMALLSNAQPELSSLMRAVLSGFAFLSACVIFMHAAVSPPPVRIDISGQGQIRLVPSRDNVPASLVKISADSDRLLSLQPNSLIFSSLLLLRLKDETGRTNALLIFPDCVSSSAFRRLSVACRWIAVQNQ